MHLAGIHVDLGARLLKRWNDVISSYWFIPTLMALGAVLLSVITVVVDVNVGGALIDEIPWLYINRPEGARAVLSTIAGSMITVAGVTFSITIASVVYASSQYGPRILGNFMRNRGNQVTLGTFVATFLYCLLILRTVRNAGDPGEGAFVPHLSVMAAILLGLCSVGVLIYFIHHIPASIHLPHVVAEIGQEVVRRIEDLYPEQIGRPRFDVNGIKKDLPEPFFDEAVPVRANGTGYIQAIDGDLLVTVARKHDLLLRIEYRPGNFISRGQHLALVWPAASVTEDVANEILQAFAWGRQRTPIQDVLFPIDELVEVAARALSPSLNDPFTAMNCLDWLGSGLACMARREIPDAFRYDEDGCLRVVSYPVTLVDVTDAVFGQLLPYFSKDRNAALQMMKVLADLADEYPLEEDRQGLFQYAEALLQATRNNLQQEYDLRELADRYKVIAHLLRNYADHREIIEENRWIKGGA